MKKFDTRHASLAALLGALFIAASASAQLRDVTQNPDISGVPGHPQDLSLIHI